MVNLIKLSTKTIPTFLELYKGANYRHALTCCAFKNYAIQTEKFPEYRENLELLTLNDDWQKDGLFLMKNGRTYYFDSLEPQPFERVKTLLGNIDYSKQVVFRAVRDQFKPMINDILWLNNLEITDQTGTTVFHLPRDHVMRLPQPPIPEGWYFRDLTSNDVDEINQRIQREGGDSLNYIGNSIKYKLALGLCDENGKLQAWAYGVDIGFIGTVGVAEQHQQKGAASAMGVKFGQQLLKDVDIDFVWNVVHGHDAALGIVRRFKANDVGTVTWMAVNKKVSKKMSQMGMYQIFYPKM